MKTEDVQVGSTIMCSTSAIRVTERVERGSGWGTAGWRGIFVSLTGVGGNTGTADFIPDYLLCYWRHVPFEWKQADGVSGVEERYVWSDDWRWLRREVRRRG